MKAKFILIFTACLCVLTSLAVRPQPATAQTSDPVVHAVMFFSPGCGYCQKVINEVLPPLFKQYGAQLQMILFDVSQPNGPAYYLSTQPVIQMDTAQLDGQTLYFAAIELFKLDYTGIPFLVVGDTYLFGSVDIPTYFPGLIDSLLAKGGVDWPAIPGFADWITAFQSTQQAYPSLSPETPTAPTATSAPVARTPIPIPTATPATLILPGDGNVSLVDRFLQDPTGNGLAILVLIGMIISVGWGGWKILFAPARQLTGARLWVIPALCIIGLGVAGYLAYVETLQVEAVCGPVGDCNTVQQSEYARLFGILPIGLLGMAGYIAILGAWAFQWLPVDKMVDLSALVMLAMTTFGTLFSIYLTFLEPFVIGATCAWCLSSAVISTALMLLSIKPGKLAVNRLFNEV
jgi:uncharacterized membrane protein/thiol-disulfide isomerase/thioredoxin